MTMRILLILAVFSNLCLAGKQEGIAALKRGDFIEARQYFLPLAEAGDDEAMITIGLMYHQGQGVKQNYPKAMDWYIKAFRKTNGDAYSNIGVMYRDGLGVEKNKKMAYCLFLITHVCSLGDQSTQQRANSCLRRIIPEMSHEELVECFDYTLEFIKAYVISKGTLNGIPENCKPSQERLSLKDKPWWLEGELDFLKINSDENSNAGDSDNAPENLSDKLTREFHSLEFCVPFVKEIGHVKVKSNEYEFETKDFHMISKGDGMESVSVSLNGPVPTQIQVSIDYADKSYNCIYKSDPNLANIHALYEVKFTLDGNKLFPSHRFSSLQSPDIAFGRLGNTEWCFDESGKVVSADKRHMIAQDRVTQTYVIKDLDIQLQSLRVDMAEDGAHIWYYLGKDHIIKSIKVLIYGQNKLDNLISYDEHGDILSCMAYNEKTKKYDTPIDNKLSDRLSEIKKSFSKFYKEYNIKQIAGKNGISLPE